MISELIIGTLTILASSSVMIVFVLLAIRLVRRAEAKYSVRRPGIWHFSTLLASAIVLVLFANTVCVWLWATLFHLLGVFETFEEAVYFSMVSFTTVGYGDVVVEHDWRILSGFVSVNGILAFGIFTAVLIEIIRGLSDRYIPRR
ncbi:potassium channel family protein [Hoeflea sp.]|uniref:potassium channel family protein n=1 Tax=Hoeflea sp. TaxID=1940281 RepID=UPI001983524D|nr:potassium channel family protein [Hoeflea sp.]MBC7280228.1 two pore domain potassium channel family protein [Hoeflea sp.]